VLGELTVFYLYRIGFNLHTIFETNVNFCPKKSTIFSRSPYWQESWDNIIGKLTRLEVDVRGILVSSTSGYIFPPLPPPIQHWDTPGLLCNRYGLSFLEEQSGMGVNLAVYSARVPR
jgi:hypothetical protein